MDPELLQAESWFHEFMSRGHVDDGDNKKIGSFLAEMIAKLEAEDAGGSTEDTNTDLVKMDKLVQAIAASTDPELAAVVAAVPSEPVDYEEPSAEQVRTYRKAVLFGMYILHAGVQVGAIVGVWNVLRHLGGASIGERGRVGSEAGAAAFAAVTFPETDRFFDLIEAHLVGCARFEGEVSAAMEHVRMVFSAAGVGAGLTGGVYLASELTESFGGPLEGWLFLGYFVGFAIGGTFVGVGELAVGKRLVEGPRPTGKFSGTLAVGAKNWLAGWLSYERLLKERLVHFVVWFMYEFYGSALGDAAKSAAATGGHLFLGLWLFVITFKEGLFWGEKLPIGSA